jgi:bifunctional non-homologous end joining protein LigD
MLFTPVKPMVASWGNEAFDDETYIFEPKWDGWRIILHKQGDRIEAFTRGGQRVTDNFPELREVASSIRADSVILDCEGIVLRDGKPLFDDFTYRLRISHSVKITKSVRTHPATFVAFDVLYVDRPLLKEPLIQRKKRLGEMIVSSSVIMPTMYIDRQGKALFELTRERDMEGIVAKRKLSPYKMGAVSDDWLKVKHAKTIDVIVLGYRTDPFELVVGLNFRTVPNKPVGVVSVGMHEADKRQFLQEASFFHKDQDRGTQWLKPRICCRILYRDRTDTHQLKLTEFVQFLWEKRPEACVWPQQP